MTVTPGVEELSAILTAVSCSQTSWTECQRKENNRCYLTSKQRSRVNDLCSILSGNDKVLTVSVVNVTIERDQKPDQYYQLIPYRKSFLEDLTMTAAAVYLTLQGALTGPFRTMSAPQQQEECSCSTTDEKSTAFAKLHAKCVEVVRHKLLECNRTQKSTHQVALYSRLTIDRMRSGWVHMKCTNRQWMIEKRAGHTLQRKSTILRSIQLHSGSALLPNKDRVPSTLWNHRI
ncbi:hypothetical protein CLF_112825 [Clonorchis sinensis]|uniref:Uncharacterized protein n=1 Tax=Clonorchis sinensis TaxID=79923 RepID=G7YX31_CLOSI|nr:hypothetical protein CLF_112825 [Clonorchis sinensis]